MQCDQCKHVWDLPTAYNTARKCWDTRQVVPFPILLAAKIIKKRNNFHDMSNDIGRSLFRVQVKIRKDKSDDYFRDVFLLRNQHALEHRKLEVTDPHCRHVLV